MLVWASPPFLLPGGFSGVPGMVARLRGALPHPALRVECCHWIGRGERPRTYFAAGCAPRVCCRAAPVGRAVLTFTYNIPRVCCTVVYVFHDNKGLQFTRGRFTKKKINKLKRKANNFLNN